MAKQQFQDFYGDLDLNKDDASNLDMPKKPESDTGRKSGKKGAKRKGKKGKQINDAFVNDGNYEPYCETNDESGKKHSNAQKNCNSMEADSVRFNATEDTRPTSEKERFKGKKFTKAGNGLFGTAATGSQKSSENDEIDGSKDEKVNSGKSKGGVKDDSEDKTFDMSFGGRHMGKMNFSKGLIHTEWAGGPDPRVYRFPHSFANRIDKVDTRTTPGCKWKRTEEDTMSEPYNVCAFCKKTGSEALKRCQRCMAVSYCGKECQRADFDEHKLFCKRCDRFDVAASRVWPAVRFYKDLRYDMNYTVLLRNLPTEHQYRHGLWCNLLVEVVGSLFHMIRYSCEVIDLSGEKTRIIFHDPSNRYEHPCYNLPGPIPMEMEELTKPGQFLLLMGAHWRFFMDGGLGIRINDLNSVYLIQMDDFETPKEYRKC